MRVDVRVIAATNRRLEEAVARGDFREDLFFRLNVVSITLPPLRERREEIPALVRHFLKKYSVHYNRPGIEIPRPTLEMFMQHDWPGNVRELENVIQRIVILGADSPKWNPLIQRRGERRSMPDRRRGMRAAEPVKVNDDTADVRREAPPVPAAAAEPTRTATPDPPPAPTEPPSLKLIGRTAARAAEREMMLRMLHRTRWNRKEAAEILGISYKALLYKIKEHRLDDPLTDLDLPGLDSGSRG
jgi:DNA-binding NtrC family response regulator